jgi:hypothetical protein
LSQVVFKGDLKSWPDVTGFLSAHALDEANAPAVKSDGKGKGAKSGARASVTASSEGPLVAGAGSIELASAAEVAANVASSEDAWMVLYHTFGGGSAASGAASQGAANAWSEAALKCNAAAGSIHAGEVNCTATPALCSSVLKGPPP